MKFAYPNKHGTPWGLWIFIGTGMVFLIHSVAHAVSTDYELKAAYIARFTEFIEWPQPEPSQNGTQRVFTICIFGDHPIEVPLNKLPRLMNVDGRPIVIQSIDSPAYATGCEILFVPAEQNQQIAQILLHIHNKPVLLINEIPDAPPHGTLISLYAEGNRLRIQIHLREVQDAGFKISSRLLKLANIVE